MGYFEKVNNFILKDEADDAKAFAVLMTLKSWETGGRIGEFNQAGIGKMIALYNVFFGQAFANDDEDSFPF